VGRQSTLPGVTSPEDERRTPESDRGGEPAGSPGEPDFSPDPDPGEPPPLDLGSTVGDVPPWGSVLVLFACGFAFAAQAWLGQVGDTLSLIAWGANVTGMPPADTAWRWLASIFLHGGAVHLMWNALNLLMFGAAIEALFARPAFWIVFAGGGAFASAASLFVRDLRGGASLSVGASGAIFALAGALIVSAVRLRKRLARGRARALGAAMLFLVATSLAGGAGSLTTDHVAHGAGLLAGFAFGAVLPLSGRLKTPDDRTTPGAGPVAIAVGWLAALALLVAFALAVARGVTSH
jgi:membrane associated rhomboid family serine protease